MKCIENQKIHQDHKTDIIPGEPPSSIPIVSELISALAFIFSSLSSVRRVSDWNISSAVVASLFLILSLEVEIDVLQGFMNLSIDPPPELTLFFSSKS